MNPNGSSDSDRLAALSSAVERLEQRVAQLEAAVAGRGAIGAARKEDSGLSSATGGRAAEGRGGPTLTPADLGRAFLVMAGAFMLRSLTDARLLPLTGGIVFGLAYALLWVLLSDRAAAGGKTVRAQLYGVTAALIAFPILWEAPTRFSALPAPFAVLLAGVMAGVALVVAWRRNLQLVAWVFVAGALLAGIALVFATRTVEPTVALLLLLGLASVWLGYGKKWRGLRWLTAATADFMVLFMVSIAASPAGVPERYAGFSIARAQALAGGLLIVYLGSFALRTLWRQRDVIPFEVVQSAAALAIGFGGAVRIAQAVGSGSGALGIVTLIAAAACYIVAFSFVDRRLGRGRNFIFYTTLAFVLIVTGSRLLAQGAILAFIWCALALTTAYLGGRYDRITLRVHSALFTLAAAWYGGLLRLGFDAFMAPAGRVTSRPGAALLAVLLGTVLTYATLVIAQGRRNTRDRARVPRVFVLLAIVICLAGLATSLLVHTARGWGLQNLAAATVAARVLVLSAAAVALAGVGRGIVFREMRWLVYPVLVLGGLALLLGLKQGNATTLFLGCACYGGALIAAPWLLRRREGLAGSGADAVADA